MKKYQLIIVFIVCLIFNSLWVDAQTDEISARSVVKLIAYHFEIVNDQQRETQYPATAWCWKDPRYLVTALHAVAGADLILINKNNEKSCHAKIIRVLKEADLALLQLDSSLMLTPLDIEKAVPDTKKDYSVWGFPFSVYSIQGDQIAFSRSLEKTPTLNSILTGDQLKADLKAQAYPLCESKILRTSYEVQPGVVGAPVFTPSGKVIGVADGGLYDNDSHFSWIVPASDYLPSLWNSKDEIPSNASIQYDFYRKSLKTNNEFVENETDIQETNDTQFIVENYDEASKRLDENGKKEISEFTRLNHVNVADYKYDVYHDLETTANFSVPHDAIAIHQDGWYYAHNPEATLHYYVLPFDAAYYSNAKDNVKSTMLSVMNNFKDDTEWKSVDGKLDQWLEDEDKQTLFFENVRVNTNKYFVFCAWISGKNLLVTSVIGELEKMGDASYLKQFGQYLLSSRIASFSAR